MKDDALERIRARLDRIDRSIVERIGERMRIVGQVAAHKADGTQAPRDERRERELLARLDGIAADAGVDGWLVRAVYRTLLDHSVKAQTDHLVDRENPGRTPDLVVGYQGADGCYSHLAGLAHHAGRPGAQRFVGFESFRDLLDAVASGGIDVAMLPVENTTAGTITESYDLLARLDLALVGEEFLRVEHVLIGLRPVPLANIRRIRSHPMALAQCSRFLEDLSNVLVERYPDTALACDALLAEQDLSQAAIASELAAERRGLAVLKRGIADAADNVTRFVVVAREPISVAPRVPCRTSVVLALRHEHGALYDALGVLARHGLNLTKLESRPRPGSAWEYHFTLDFEGNLASDDARAAVEELRARTPFLKVLGCYPRRPRPPTVAETALTPG